MKYEDLIKISDPYKVYIKFKEIYPCDSFWFYYGRLHKTSRPTKTNQFFN